MSVADPLREVPRTPQLTAPGYRGGTAGGVAILRRTSPVQFSCRNVQRGSSHQTGHLHMSGTQIRTPHMERSTHNKNPWESKALKPDASATSERLGELHHPLADPLPRWGSRGEKRWVYSSPFPSRQRASLVATVWVKEERPLSDPGPTFPPGADASLILILFIKPL